jgi:predicted RNase H-like nuclease (RuvC/YqgF family)
MEQLHGLMAGEPSKAMLAAEAQSLKERQLQQQIEQLQDQMAAERRKVQAAAEAQAQQERQHKQHVEQQQRRLSALKEKCSKAKDTALPRQLAVGRKDKKHHGQVTDLREQVAGLEVTQGTATSAG